MIIIRTPGEMARALGSPLTSELTNLLRGHWERLSQYVDYDLSELAEFVIVQQSDTLADVEAALSMPLIELEDGQPTFALGPEVVEQHLGCLELTFIYSDDGYGMILFLELGPKTDPILLAACQHELGRIAG